MTRFPVLIAVALLPWVTVTAQAKNPAPMKPMPAHVVTQAAGIHWGAAPPAFEKGAQSVVLLGDPGANGPFTLRLKAPPGFKVAMHWHPADEQVTVIQGDLVLRTDDGSAEQRVGTGDYVAMPAKMHHAVSTKGGAIVQVSGIGPFEINYINPKEDPRLRAKSK